MKQSHKFLTVASACLLLLLVTALVTRFMSPTRTVTMATRDAKPIVVGQTQATGTIPEFTSASFSNPDPFLSLGPEWTFVRQADLDKSDGRWLDGTVPVREASVKLVGKETSLLIIELRITDEAKLKASLARKQVVATKAAGRDGYILPMNDAAGGTGFALVGTNRILIIQHGKSYLWPSELESEIVSYVSSVNVP